MAEVVNSVAGVVNEWLEYSVHSVFGACLLFGWNREMVNFPIYSECSAYLSLRFFIAYNINFIHFLH